MMKRSMMSSQRLLRHRSNRTTTTSMSSSAISVSSHPAPSIDGRSYLLPTLTLQRTPGSNQIAIMGLDDPRFLSTRRGNHAITKTPIVLDLQLVSSDGSPHAQPIKKHELRRELDRLQTLGCVLVGITNASEDIKQLASSLHLPYLVTTRPHSSNNHPIEEPHHLVHKQDQDQVNFSTNPTTSTASLPPLILYSSVRSGQQIFAQHRSLLVLGNVNSGAEVLADHNIYIFGTLKGRALAGIGGNVDAQIVCQSFDAELISIAHHFTTCEALENEEVRRFKPTTISIQHDQLHFQSSD